MQHPVRVELMADGADQTPMLMLFDGAATVVMPWHRWLQLHTEAAYLYIRYWLARGEEPPGLPNLTSLQREARALTTADAGAAD